MQQGANYSGQHKRPLQKLHIHCSTRGEILSASGLWAAGCNDASILRSILKLLNNPSDKLIL